MSFHKLFKLILLLQLVTGWQTLLFLSHVEHHLLHSRSCFSIQIRQLRRLGIDLLSVDLDVSLDGSAPPAGLVFPFFNIKVKIFSFISFEICTFDGPIGLINVNFIFPFAIDQSSAIDDDQELFHRVSDLHILFCNFFI